MTRHPKPALPWLVPGDPFPEPDHAWGPHSPAPGLLAAGGSLDVATLTQAYARGIFPWFGPGQPVLWWSPDPRMVLATRDFRLHRSLRQAVRRFRAHPQAQIRIDSDFEAVIAACATTPREGQNGTWIVPEMIRAYGALHQAGLAHSVETWVEGRLVGGLYLVAIGRAVFGESMFAHATDASKIALAALVALCRAQGVTQIDCQQNTSHLASLGAAEIRRADFLAAVDRDVQAAPCEWQWRPVYWNALIPVQP